MKLTINAVLDMDPCYEDEQIVGLFRGRMEVDALDAEGVIPPADLVWLWLHCLPTGAVIEFASACADRASAFPVRANASGAAAAKYAAETALRTGHFAARYACAAATHATHAATSVFSSEDAAVQKAERKTQINMLRGMLESTVS